jgi:hypothetical protein
MVAQSTFLQFRSAPSDALEDDENALAQRDHSTAHVPEPGRPVRLGPAYPPVRELAAVDLVNRPMRERNDKQIAVAEVHHADMSAPDTGCVERD